MTPSWPTEGACRGNADGRRHEAGNRRRTDPERQAQLLKVSELVEQARKGGTNVVCGGQAPAGSGYIYPLTLVTDIADGATLVDEEQFGPVLPIIKYRDIDEAVGRANRLNVGLGAPVWSQNIQKARDAAMRLQARTVWINQHGTIHPMVPFDSIKGSGWGAEFGSEGLKVVSRQKVISLRK